jgi:peptide/nickel transport system ATP-binding protein
VTPPLLEAEGLVRRYRRGRRGIWGAPEWIAAIAGVSLAVARGRSLGIVGESGSGKSTLARLAMALEPPDAGSLRWLGEDVSRLSAPALRKRRRGYQMIFQDPYGSLDPRHPIGRIVGEPLEALAGAAERKARAAEALASVGLAAADAGRYPHEFSGGQRQRIAIARALVTRPALIVADEPVSALDVSIQAQILNLLKRLEAEHGVTYLFISHDLAVVEYVTAELAVMYAGAIVEVGPTAELLADPRHPYTQALKAAVPRLEPGARRRRRAAAAPPRESGAPGGGCAFAPRCPIAAPRCRDETPELRLLASGRRVACHLA